MRRATSGSAENRILNYDSQVTVPEYPLWASPKCARFRWKERFLHPEKG